VKHIEETIPIESYRNLVHIDNIDVHYSCGE